jgi:hypothetical protein
MNQTLPIINLDHQWYLMQGNNLNTIDKPNILNGSNVILTDFNDAVFGVETVTGPIEHSAALIEKRLREMGLLDGPGKVIVHNARKAGDTVTVLYTAISAEGYAEYFELINRQKDHCVIVPLLSVLAKQFDAKNDDGQAIVFHHNRQFDLIVMKDKRIKKVSRFTSFSNTKEDVASIFETLSEELINQNQGIDDQIKDIKWFSFLDEDSHIDNLVKKLADSTGINVSRGHHSDVILNDKKYKTSITSFYKKINSKDAANDTASKIFYNSEKYLPWVATVFAAILIGLMGLMFKWNGQIKNIEHELSQSNRNQLEAEIIKINEDLAQSNKDFAKNKDAQKISQWLYNLNGVQSSPDPKQLVTDIGKSLPEDVKIVGISLNSRTTPATVVLDGVIEKPLKLAMKDLDNMSANLLNSGYKMLSDSSIELKDNNDFRMTLKVDYNDK